MQRIKIIYDADKPYNTRVVDAETGELIHGITQVELSLTLESATAILYIPNPILEIAAKDEERRVLFPPPPSVDRRLIGKD